jgi:hypothetical protein
MLLKVKIRDSKSIRRSSSAARPLDVLELLARRLRRRLGVAEPAVTVLWDSVRRRPPSALGRPVTARLVHGSSTRCSCMPQSKAVTLQIPDAYWSLGDQYKSTGLTLATLHGRPSGSLAPAVDVTRPGWSRSVLALFTVYRLERR